MSMQDRLNNLPSFVAARIDEADLRDPLERLALYAAGEKTPEELRSRLNHLLDWTLTVFEQAREPLLLGSFIELASIANPLLSELSDGRWDEDQEREFLRELSLPLILRTAEPIALPLNVTGQMRLG